MTIYIVSLEPLPNRYTVEWFEGIPNTLRDYISQNGLTTEVVNIVGDDKEQLTTPGAFINFAGTNKWKSEQSIQISKLVAEGKVKDGDKFLFTDAWNPAILQLKYMLDLLQIKAEISGIWHAGQYDPQDFLGRLIEDKRWARNTEEAIFWALDKNIFATHFHFSLFSQGVLAKSPTFEPLKDRSRVLISGQPHEALVAHLESMKAQCGPSSKKDMILFGHRIAPEKQHDIFLDLKASMPEYEFVTAQEKKLTKAEYHQLLCEAKIVFSANLQETLGISQVEGILCNAFSLNPDRLSYKEMFFPEFKYPSEWTESFDAYLAHKEELIALIHGLMNSYDHFLPMIQSQKEMLVNEFFSANVMYDYLIGKTN
jgi:hypothetical protein